MQKQGWTIVDVRIEGDFDKNHAVGAVNIPFFRFVQGTEFWCVCEVAVKELGSRMKWVFRSWVWTWGVDQACGDG